MKTKFDLLDAKQVAERLNISVRLAQRHMHDRVIETVDVSGGGKLLMLRVRPEALEAFIRQRTRETETGAPELRIIKPKKRKTVMAGAAWPESADGKIPDRKISVRKR